MDLTLFDCMVAKKGYVIEAKLSTSLDSTVFPMFPVHNIDFNMEWNKNTIMRLTHTNTMMSPVHYSLTVPVLLPSPIEVKLPQTVSMIAEPFGEMISTFTNLFLKSIFEINLNSRMTKVHLPFIMDPLLSVSWNNVELMNNKLSVIAKIPNLMTVSEIEVDWNCKTLLECNIKNDVTLRLPTLGETHLNNFNTIVLGTAKSQVSIKTALVHTNGILALLPPLDISYTWINSKIYNNQVQTTVNSDTLGKIFYLTMDGRCKNLLKCTYKTEISGEVPVVGKYHLTDSYSYLMKSTNSKVSSSVSANFSKGLLSILPQLKHTVTADLDHTILSLEAKSSTTLYGNTFGVVVSGNKIVQILY